MKCDIDTTRLRAVLDLAICQLHEDAQSLEAAGMENQAEAAHACGQLLKTERLRIFMNLGVLGHKSGNQDS